MRARMTMRVLVLERDDVTRASLARVIRARGHAVDACEELDQAWQAYQSHGHSLAVLDWTTPDGPALCCRIRAGHGRCVILAANLAGDAATLREALHTGADDWLPNALDATALEARLALAESQVRQRE